MTENEYLFQKVHEIRYPVTMKIIAGEVRRVAFFPGGKGTFDNGEQISGKRIMVLGQDFGSKKGWLETVASKVEDLDKFATWRNILLFFNQCGIDPNDCFFTNAFMGIREGDNATGRSPGFKDEDFLKQCREFFLEQIKIQRPKVILVLGIQLTEFLAGTSKDLISWKSIKSFKSADTSGEQIKRNVVFDNGVQANLALLLHPSFRGPNLRHRRYQGLHGNPAEVAIVRNILQID